MSLDLIGAADQRTLHFRVLGRHVAVSCPAGMVADRVLHNFAAMRADGVSTLVGVEVDASRSESLHYSFRPEPSAGGLTLSRAGQPDVVIDDADELLYHLERDLTVALQRMRPDLLFVHAAALAWRDQVWLLAGHSGDGKSTTAWGLLHHGLRYLSDELSPIQPDSMLVDAYPHALCMKRQPPPDYPLPSAGVLDLGATIHVAAAALPGRAGGEPMPLPMKLGGVIFVRHHPGLAQPRMTTVSAAEAAARLYVTTLNALAHVSHGLDAVARIAERVPCFALATGELRASCELVVTTLEAEASR